MNEVKKKHYDFFNPTTTKSQQQAEDLLMEIKSFIGLKKDLSVDDWMIINNMINQLSNKKAAFPHKILRGMRNKFISIQQQYVR